MRFEIVPREHGVLLTLEHSRLEREALPGYAAGWHSHLDALGGAIPRGRASMTARYRELRPEYEGRFG